MSKYIFSFLLFFLIPGDVYSYISDYAFEPYCDDLGCYDVKCTAPVYQGQYDIYQDSGPDVLAVKCNLSQYCYDNLIECANSVAVLTEFDILRGYHLSVGGGDADYSDQFRTCEQELTHHTDCGTSASPASMGNGSAPFPSNINEVTFKPEMWLKDYWVNTLLGCGPTLHLYTDVYFPAVQGDTADCPLVTEAVGFPFDLTMSVPYGSGNKCYYSYNNGFPYTSDNMTPCGYCFNICADSQHNNPVNCQCYFPECPQGQKWSEVAGACIIDPCPPPLFDTGGGVCDINCPQIKSGLTCLNCVEVDPAFPIWDPVALQCVPDVASCVDLDDSGWMFDFKGECAQCNDVGLFDDPRPPDSFRDIARYPDITIDFTYDGLPVSYGDKFQNDSFIWLVPNYNRVWPAGLYSRDYNSLLTNCSTDWYPFYGPYLFTSSTGPFNVNPLFFDGTHGSFISAPLTPGIHNFGMSVDYVSVLGLELQVYYWGYSNPECSPDQNELWYIDPGLNNQSVDFDALGEFEVCSEVYVWHPACELEVKGAQRCVTAGSFSFGLKGTGSKVEGGNRSEFIYKHIGRGGYDRVAPAEVCQSPACPNCPPC